MRLGSLFSGYGGLEMAVEQVTGACTVWVSDIDKGACKILAHRYPDLPNLGDITKVDWSTVEPVEVLCAGFPCQPVSNAGKQLGDLDERWLWDDLATAIRVLRPGLVVLENVRGLLTAGDGRLFGRVLGALADLGYDAQWHCLRAGDVGAPHGRLRVFVVAHAAGQRRPGTFQSWADLKHDGPQSAHRGEDGGALLPTPAVNDMGEGKTPDAWDEWTDAMQAKHGNGNGHGKSLSIEAQRLLPTPMAYVRGEGTYWMPEREEQLWTAPNDGGTPWLESAVSWVERDGETKWGQYADVITRWEQLTRTAPAPTMLSTKGTPQLSPAFSEWMMGLPAGWVTDVPGITRNEALKALGNGVVPQQAAAALRYLLSIEVAA